MRAPYVGLALVLLVQTILPAVAAQDFGEVGKVNRLISVFETPQLAPGDSGRFRFELNSTYAEEIVNVTLLAEIYMYATIEEAVPVDATWASQFEYPKIEGAAGPSGRERTWTFASVAAGTATPLNFTVLTVPDANDMPHGSVFSQATYFVRFRLDFDGNVSGTWTHFVMASRGHFTASQWSAATNETNTNPCVAPWCRGNLNLTYLTVDGNAVAGLLPDSSFGVKEPIPLWPFYGLIAGAAIFLVLAFFFWVEENPGTYPRVEEWWARARGKFARFRRVPRRTKGTAP